MSDDDKNLPATQEDDFIAAFEKGKMDLSKLKDLIYVVAVNTGSRNKCKLLASTIHGPYDFYEMVEQVGFMHRDNMHHAKITILDKDSDKPTLFLDSGTTDYIQAFWQDIITEGVLEAACVTEYSCEAGFVHEVKAEKEATEECG